MTTQAHEGQQVLIVEDEPKIARLVADYLEGSGFATHHLDHGDSVLPWLTEGRQAGQGPDLVLLDLMLPGTDGLTLCRELRQRWRSSRQRVRPSAPGSIRSSSTRSGPRSEEHTSGLQSRPH